MLHALQQRGTLRMDQPAEILDGNRLMGTLRGAIESRRVCRMEIPNTKFSWITLILGIQSSDESHYLLIDKVAEFEKAFSQSRNNELVIDFMEADGVPCHFTTRLVELRPDGLWVELPDSIFRMQKRRFYRVKARLGTELIFRLNVGREERSSVRDYSMGGVAFAMERPLELKAKDQVSDVELKVPQGRELITFYSPLAVVIRIESQFMGKDICVMEFMDMSEATKEKLWRHIFEEQRMLLKKVRQI
jgi:c-di-GMP-binding flagellar brake protein YcgR